MRKNYIYLVLLLVFNTGMFAQKVILTPTAVNGASISSSGPINLGGTPSSTVSLGIRVEMPTIPGNTGTISIYSLNGLNANVVTGGNGGVLIFNEGNVASRSFVVNLNWSSFPTSGGFIFAEYKTASGVAYKSGYISVTKNATMGGGTINPPADAPNPSKITNTLCCNQIVRLGEKPAPIVGSQYLNPYENYIHGINNRWNINNGRILSLDNINKTLHLDYTKEIKNIIVTRELGYNGNSDYPNKSNAVTITIIPSPLDYNVISIDAPKDLNGYAEIIDTNPIEIIGSVSVMNVNTLQNPSNVPKRGDKYTTIERYEWEYYLADGKNIWLTIPNQNSNSLNSSNIPNLKIDNDNLLLIRRIAIYENLRISSNSLQIVLRTIRNNNTICCDQKLKILSSEEIEKPLLLNGSTAVSDKNALLFYQWQQRLINDRENTSNWSNISGATSKDYLPLPLQYITNPRGNTIPNYSYRRIAETNYYGGEISYSNEISISHYTDRSSSSTIILHPNPATSIINIEDTNKRTYGGSQLEGASIIITNSFGNIVNSNNFTLVNSTLATVNISNLPAAIYIVNITQNNRTIYTGQFIKN